MIDYLFMDDKNQGFPPLPYSEWHDSGLKQEIEQKLIMQSKR